MIPTARNLLTGFLLLLQAAAVAPAQADESIILANGEWEPYYGARLPHQGADSAIVSEAFALVGIKVTYRFYPWARGFAEARDLHDVSGAVGWADRPEYRKDFWISDTTSIYQMVFFHRVDAALHWQILSDLKGKRVGLIYGYDYPQALLSMVAAGTVKADWVSDGETCLRMLGHGRLDLYPEDRVVGALMLKKLAAELGDKVVPDKMSINDDSLHLLLSKAAPQNEGLMAKFNEGLRQLKASGRYDEIRADMMNGAYSAQ